MRIEQARALRHGATAPLTGLLDPETTAVLRDGLEVKAVLSEQTGEMSRRCAAVLAHLRRI